jgi:DNA-binding NarL/FixJ family response regulator
MKLTNSEFEILKALYVGKSYKEIAGERFVEQVTIRTQVTNILRKFNEKKIKNLINTLRENNFFEKFNDLK